MKNELLEIEVSRYNPTFDEIVIESGHCRRLELEAFIKKTRTEPTDIIHILVFRDDGDYLWDAYHRSWTKYKPTKNK